MSAKYFSPHHVSAFSTDPPLVEEASGNLGAYVGHLTKTAADVGEVTLRVLKQLEEGSRILGGSHLRWQH